jgi:hypothetical protein
MKIIVFIRSHNDFDQVLPILDYLIRIKNQVVEVYGVGDDYKNCTKHIHYLENVLLNKVISFYDAVLSNTDNKILNILHRSMFNKCSGKFKIFCSIVQVNFSEFVYYIVSLLSINKFIDNLSCKDIILVDGGSERIFPCKHIVSYAEVCGISTIGYAHGYDIFTNKDPIRVQKTRVPKIILKILNKYFLLRHNNSYCNKYIVGPGQILAYSQKATMHVNFIEYSRLVEIGMPRFSREWIDIFFGRGQISKQIYKKINVVLFLSNVKFNVNTSLLQEMIGVLSSYPEVNFKIAPHTRSGLTGLIDKKNENITNLSSAEIIKWADVGIVYGSSIAFHMLIENVVILNPKFIDHNTNVYGDNDVAVIVESLDDMLVFFNDFFVKKQAVNKINVDQFVDKYIYGNFLSYEDMMDSFFDHIMNTENGKI